MAKESVPPEQQLIDSLGNPQRSATFKAKFEIYASPHRQEVAATISAGYEPRPKIIESILQRADKHQERYNALKNSFTRKIAELQLTNPLIHFDDTAMRIDIGYGMKEFTAIFPDWLGYGGEEGQNTSFTFWDLLRQYTHRALFDPLAVFEQNFVCQEYSQSLIDEKEALIENFNSLPTKPLPSLSEAITHATSEVDLIEGMLAGNSGLVVGEAHQCAMPKQFLIDNMATLKEKGVTTIYLEHLIYESHQQLLDEYLRAGSAEPMPIELELYLKKIDKEFNLEGTGTFYHLVKAAKESGIRIIAIDTAASYSIVDKHIADLSSPEVTVDRMKAMNAAMVKRFEEHPPENGGKFVAFVGSAHASNLYYKDYNQEFDDNRHVSGISQLLGCPNLVIIEPNELEAALIEPNKAIEEGKKKIVPQFTYTCNKNKRLPSSTTSLIEATEVTPDIGAIPLHSVAAAAHVDIEHLLVDGETNDVDALKAPYPPIDRATPHKQPFETIQKGHKEEVNVVLEQDYNVNNTSYKYKIAGASIGGIALGGLGYFLASTFLVGAMFSQVAVLLVTIAAAALGGYIGFKSADKIESSVQKLTRSESIKKDPDSRSL